jgi:RNA polymerase sigma-70 factor (ECF subfamily)
MEESSFTDFIQSHVAGAYRLAAAIIGNRGDAEDAAGAAILNAWKHWPRLRDQSRAEAWFNRIVVNACRDQLRRQRRTGFAAVVDTAPGDERLAERDLVYGVLARLRLDHRVILVLRYYDDRPLADIADQLGIPLGTVKSRLNAASRSFRTMLIEVEGISP